MTDPFLDDEPCGLHVVPPLVVALGSMAYAGFLGWAVGRLVFNLYDALRGNP